MSSIYIHIPFCKKACHYCDFHFSTSLKHADEMVDAICKELILKKNRISTTVGSIYFGGGTPSLLTEKQLQKIFETLLKNYEVAKDAEITIEANPDDLHAIKLQEFKHLPINRLSVGIQSFYNEDLLWMNRAHNAAEAESCIKRSQDIGFENLTLDLIYGYPLLTDPKWLSNIQTAIQLQVPHISAYALTVEPRTALAHAIKTHKQTPVNEQQSADQFITLIHQLKVAGFEQYEISNFARAGQYAIHNTNYWRGVHYIGIGPSAHGFDGTSRSYNPANNLAYMQKLLNNELAEDQEILSVADQHNEYVMTSLRTMWGVNLQNIITRFGSDYHKNILQEAERHLKNNYLIKKDNFLHLSEQGKLFADKIASDLFVLNE